MKRYDIVDSQGHAHHVSADRVMYDEGYVMLFASGQADVPVAVFYHPISIIMRSEDAA